jgi:hypothetical protein
MICRTFKRATILAAAARWANQFTYQGRVAFRDVIEPREWV